MKKIITPLIGLLLIMLDQAIHAQTWQTVGSANFTPHQANSFSMAVTPSGTPYVAFRKDDFGNTRKPSVMKYDGTAWVSVGPLFLSNAAVNDIAIAVAANSVPYVLFSDPNASFKATVMKYDGSNWVTVGTAGFSAGAPSNFSIMVDGSGTPYVAYADAGNGSKATVMKFNGSSWETVGLAGFTAATVTRTQLAISGSTPYIAVTTGGGIKVMKFDGTAWAEVGTLTESGSPSIAISSDGTPYIAYNNSSNSNKATVRKYDGSNWVLVGSGNFSAGTASNVSIVLDDQSTPYVSYSDAVNNYKGVVMKYDGSSWAALGSTSLTPGSFFIGKLAIDNNRNLYFGYQDNLATVLTCNPFTPSVSTATPVPISTTVANMGGSILSDQGSPIIARGVVYSSINGTPTLLNGTSASMGSGSGSFSQDVTGLNAGTTYYARAYATNAYGTSYGTVQVFTTPLSPPGNALLFDGTNDVVKIAAATTKFDVAVLTAECWVKRTAMNGTNVGLMASRGSSTRFSIHMGNSTIGLYNGSSYNAVNTVAFEAGKWYHIAMVIKASTADVYVNGTLVGSTTNGMGTATNQPFQIGSAAADGSAEQVNGAMDEVRIWNYARSAAQIGNSYLNILGSPSSQTGLLAYYMFDQGIAAGTNTGITTLADSSASPLNGTLTNFALTGSSSNWVESYAMVMPVANAATGIGPGGFTANWSVPTVGTVDNGYKLDVSTSSTFATAIAGSPFSVASTSQAITGLAPNTTYYYRVRADKTSITGQGGYSSTISLTTSSLTAPGNALLFDGTNDVVVVSPATTKFDVPVLTAECWVKRTSLNGANVCLMASRGSSTRFSIHMGNSSIGLFNGSSYNAVTTPAFEAGKWYHIAMIIKAASSEVYINSILAGYTTNGMGTGINQPLLIGAAASDGSVEQLNGAIDEVRLWNYARSYQDLSGNFLLPLTNPTAQTGLLAYYKFDQGIAGGTNTGTNTLVDSSASALHGTLTNFALANSTSNWVESYAMAMVNLLWAVNLTTSSCTLNWAGPAVGSVENFVLDVSTNSNFSSFVAGYNGLNFIPPSNNAYTITGLTPGTLYYARLRTNKASVSNQSVPVNANFTTLRNKLFTGAVDNFYYNSQNWQPSGTPDYNDFITIPTGKTCILNSSYVVGNINIEANATLNIMLYSSLILQATSPIINGTISGEGTLEWRNISLYSLSMTGTGTLSNLLLDGNGLGNPYSIKSGTDNNIKLTGTLTTRSYVALTTNNNLTFASTSTGTARLAALATGSSILGNVNVQRYIPGGYRKYRFLGHPFSTSMNLTEITDDIDVTGTITGSNANNFTATASSNPSAYLYTEANGDGNINDAGWTAITSGNTISVVPAGQGIRLLVRGSKGQAGSLTGSNYTPDPVTISMSGPLKQGDFTQSLSYTAGADKGWNLISNPYPSNVDWTTVTRTNVNNAIYTYRPILNTYASYINGSATNGASRYIESGSAFMVRTSGTNPTLGWHETDKVSNTPTNSVFRTYNNIHNRLSLVLVNDSTQNSDEVIIRFGDDPATDGFDREYDAENLAVANDLYVLDNQQKSYSIYHGSTLKMSTEEKRAVALGLTVNLNGNYSLNMKTLDAFTNGNTAWLKDAYTGSLVEIGDSTVYHFTVTADMASKGNTRFSVLFNAKEKPVLTASINELSIKLSPNPAKGMVQLTYAQQAAYPVTVTITDAAGRQLQTINLGKVQQGVETISLNRFGSGTYFILFSNGKETRTEKLLVE